MKVIAGFGCAALLFVLMLARPAVGERADLARPDASAAADGDFTIGPDYANPPELTVKPGVPMGTVHAFTMRSQDSRYYPGIAKKQSGVVPYQRKVWVYVPRQYVAGTPAPFIVVQDGQGYLKTLPPILDNMIDEHRLPVMIAVLINSGGGDGQGSERGLEYDTVSARYADFVENEVLPRISLQYNVTFTNDPDGRATMGGSSGGAAAFTMGWFRPDLYHRVLTYSGTYVNQQSPPNPASLHGAWEYHEHLIPQTSRKPLRVWMEVGENDNGAKRDEASLHNWVMANQRMAAVLKARGYHYRYVFAKGARHVDGRVVRQTLPAALEWLWNGYTPRPQPIRIWPGLAPGEKGDIGPEHDTTKADPNLPPDKYVIRLGDVSVPTITVFRPTAEKDIGAAVIVCPGGAYQILAYNLEGTEICRWLNSVGVTGVLLKYRVPARHGLEKYTAALQDVQRAIGIVRHRAGEWKIDPHRIGVIGFSAGGHLSAAVSNVYAKRTYPPIDASDQESCRPDFAMLIYPAYLSANGSPAQLAPEFHVTSHTSPAFIVMAEDDPVGVQNALAYLWALKAHKVPAELHVYPTGGHGYGLRPSSHAVTTWPARAADWMRSQGWIR